MYGLTEDEINYVWDQYKVIFDHKINSKPMNESIDNKKEFYLEKIVQFMVDDTKIDHQQILFPFMSSPYLSVNITKYTFSYFYTVFSDYCIDTYGLTDNEIYYVWNQYKKFILEKVYSLPMNESVDNKKEKYLDKIVKYLVEDTKIDYELGEIILPFPVPPLFVARFPFDFINEQHYLRLRYFFQEYLKDTYGLTDNEIYYVWEKYRTNILDKNSKPMNESVDSKKIYLDKIVEYLVDDTFIDYDEGEIKYPYYSNILLLHNHQLPFSVHSFRAFSIYCKDMYGLDIEEIQYVWKHYREKIVQK
jgi:hypothetical protein